MRSRCVNISTCPATFEEWLNCQKGLLKGVFLGLFLQCLVIYIYKYIYQVLPVVTLFRGCLK